MKWLSNYVISVITLCSIASVFCAPASASGIVLGGTRVVFPAEATQTTLSVKNRSDASTYLVQSWVEEAGGKKTGDFIVTPPLYTSAPGNENMLRIISSGVPHPKDKESLYYLNVKLIPSVDKKALDKEGGGSGCSYSYANKDVRPSTRSEPRQRESGRVADD